GPGDGFIPEVDRVTATVGPEPFHRAQRAEQSLPAAERSSAQDLIAAVTGGQWLALERCRGRQQVFLRDQASVALHVIDDSRTDGPAVEVRCSARRQVPERLRKRRLSKPLADLRQVATAKQQSAGA